MEIGLSTASYFNKMQIEDTVLDIGAHGVRLCELFLNTYSEYEPDFVEQLAARLEQAGVRVFSVHPMSMQFEPQLFSVHPRQRGDALRLFRRVLAAGRRVGAVCYVMHGPARLFGGVKNIELTRIAPILVDLTALAAEYGIQLTLENVSWCLFNAPEFGLRLADATGGMIKHTLDVKQAVRSGFDPMDYVRAVGENIVNVHLCDAAQLPSGSVRYEMPGFGSYDFTKMFDLLSDKGYLGPAFVEVYSDMYREIPKLYESLASMQAAAARSRLGAGCPD
ncbi:MAG: sugar phosphate isomerase/epimerase [Clostridiales bacterium]|nr:sugar phosphate isomerase/epimerase [Clostridiales bacterium]